jgi:hypothetical protein
MKGRGEEQSGDESPPLLSSVTIRALRGCILLPLAVQHFVGCFKVHFDPLGESRGTMTLQQITRPGLDLGGSSARERQTFSSFFRRLVEPVNQLFSG